MCGEGRLNMGRDGWVFTIFTLQVCSSEVTTESQVISTFNAIFILNKIEAVIFLFLESFLKKMF